ncbi:26S proteasome non-ATPase regulatory subunit [Lambiella insularis]|nr:26S proteasome non-ATPase regulatory subunit [Lambiella insularis]
MPAERRNLRSSKDSTTNGEKSRSDSQSSASNKDKPLPARSTSSKSKANLTKKGLTNTLAKDMGGDKSRINGTEPAENGVNGNEDIEMEDDAADKTRSNGIKEGEDEMTVVVPPPNSSKLAGEPPKDLEGDTSMEEIPVTAEDPGPVTVDPKTKAVSDIQANFELLERAVAQFDTRFTLRVLRSISSVRKLLSSDVLAQVITKTYQSSSHTAKSLLSAIGEQEASFDRIEASSEMEIDGQSREKPTSVKPLSPAKDVLPEVDTYLSILVQIHLYDKKAADSGAEFSSNLVDRLRTLNRRTLDALSARVYFYYSLFYEQLEPLPPSPMAPVVSIRQNLLAALRTSVLRKDQDTQATVTTLLLRNYLSTSHITQADLLISHSQFPAAASNNQIARYLYYLGRIRAIQLSYTEAHEHLISATRKSPSSHSAGGFYQASTKLLIVVELLMGDIPDRATFRQPSLERSLEPYLQLVQAVRVGDLDSFLKIVQASKETFRKDGTYTLILRLRQNVIKTGIRMMSLSYARISLRDICVRLGLPSEETAEYIVAKAIRDDVIEATLDHEHGYMKSKDVGDIYATREPGEAFHERIRACLDLHDESVKAMRFPMNQHRLELKNAQEARERERELAKEIVEGEMDDDDAGGEFEGMIDVSIRLRRAIHLNDLILVQRIVKNNPASLQNPDFTDKGNTSLHLVAKLGFLPIATFLIDAGHEEDGISRNADGDTPLMLAVEASEEVAACLAERFARCVEWTNKKGVDALMLASRAGSSALIPTLFAVSSDPSALLSASDIDGNTALHYASAYGHLKCIRMLLQAGASPVARNAYSWTAVSYSSTVAAEVYFRNLVGEIERGREGEREREREMSRRREGGVRVVGEDDRGGDGWSREMMQKLEPELKRGETF